MTVVVAAAVDAFAGFAAVVVADQDAADVADVVSLEQG